MDDTEIVNPLQNYENLDLKVHDDTGTQANKFMAPYVRNTVDKPTSGTSPYKSKLRPLAVMN